MAQPTPRPYARRWRLPTAVAGAALLLATLTPAVEAETPSPSPAPAPESSTGLDEPSASPSPSPTATPPPVVPGLGLTVGSSGGPVTGVFYEDLGRFAFEGTTTGVADQTTVTLSVRAGAGAWTRVATALVSAGHFLASSPVQAAGALSFRATVPGDEGAELSSPVVPVTVRDTTVALVKPTATIDSLKNLTLSGTITPARAGVSVHVDVRSGSGWKQVAVAPTTSTGRFTTSLGYGRGELTSYVLRATYRATNRDRWETSASQGFARVAVLDALVSPTTGDDVTKTYRKGCPVGPSKLRTVHLNHYGRDRRMHRGVIIIRADLTDDVIRGFSTALEHRYPVAKMDNPDAYGGSDPKQMEANNTSGFNCRKVVGNPYAQSPHSYGIALDVNTVQNPYRDRTGKWWPKKGKAYIDRTPRRWGMLSKGSYLTASLRHDDFLWGGAWNPGRDYQHFEYRG